MDTEAHTQAGSILRFSVGRRLEHHINALVFATLVVTGLAQRFHDAAWASWVVLHLGGIDNVRLIHRATGVLFSILVIVHASLAAYGLLFRGWRPALMVNFKDFRDALTSLRYYFGLTDEPARCDRFDYKQKFEYWGVVMGGFLMTGTGWVLWLSSRLYALVPFLPGELIPAAKAAHSNEAMMAFLVIVIWHIYNSVFSPEVFPLDTAIFTGRISVARMHHEHPLELARLERESQARPAQPLVRH